MSDEFPDPEESLWFTDGQRPQFELVIRQVGWKYWPYFKPFHYLADAGPMAFGTAYVGFVDDEPVTHLGMSGKTSGGPDGHILREARACRLVIHPEWQGAGIGVRFLTYMCERELQGQGFIGQPTNTLFHTGHPALVAALRRDNRWRTVKNRLIGGNKRPSPYGNDSWFGGHVRPVATFRYFGQRGIDAA